MWSLPLSHKFNQFNNLEARMLDSKTYHNIETTLNHTFRCENVNFLSLCTQR